MAYSYFKILSPKGTSYTNFDSKWGNESFVQHISPLNKCDAIFGNYFGVQEPILIHTVLKFDILRVPLITYTNFDLERLNLEFCLVNFPVEQI
jgi:hypothetical protein